MRFQLYKFWEFILGNSKRDVSEKNTIGPTGIGVNVQNEDDNPVDFLKLKQKKAENFFDNNHANQHSKEIVLDDLKDINHIDDIDLTNKDKAQVLQSKNKDGETLKKIDVEKIISSTINCIHYYDKLYNQVPTEDLKTIIDDFTRQLIDNLILAGCEAISEEPGLFNMTRHQVIPFQIIEEGTPYKRIIRKGIINAGEVKLLAIVEL